MSLLTKRQVYKPFEYPRAYQFWELQQQSHWLHTEISMASDIQDWKEVITPTEKHLIGTILKGFTQAELVIGNDYWSKRITKWFKKPEIQIMATAFASMETVHAVSYAYLNDSLGLDDYSAFLFEPSAKAKIDRIMEVKGTAIQDIAKSLAVFSAFNEGVSLFSSFAILLNFSRFNKLKGLGQIIAFSIKDESLHSEGGCWLFRTLIEENPDIWTDELKKELYEAAKLTVQLEDAFIDKAFELGDVEGLTKHDMKQFIRHRCNTKLQDIKLKSIYKNIDKEALKRLEWFDVLSAGVSHSDFFASRVSDYSRGSIDFDKMW
jgi:ribonucleoside-diphosphate reductase beta chain